MTSRDDVIAAFLRCPDCGGSIELTAARAVCNKTDTHSFPRCASTGIVTFGSPDAGDKYTGEEGAKKAERYATAIAYAYETRHSGHGEGLYQTVAAFIARGLVSRAATTQTPVIVSCGCGVGREAMEAATLAPAGQVIAIDGSAEMLHVAHQMVSTSGTVPSTMNEDRGFMGLNLQGKNLANVFFARADAQNVPVADACADIVLSIYMIDRLPQWQLHLKECYRVLSPGGFFLLVDPLNWQDRPNWENYAGTEAVLSATSETGFNVRCWFDDLAFCYPKDRRGSMEEFRSLVIWASKDHGDAQ